MLVSTVGSGLLEEAAARERDGEVEVLQLRQKKKTAEEQSKKKEKKKRGSVETRKKSREKKEEKICQWTRHRSLLLILVSRRIRNLGPKFLLSSLS